MERIGDQTSMKLEGDIVHLERCKPSGYKRYMFVEKALFMEVNEKKSVLQSGAAHMTKVGNKDWSVVKNEFGGRKYYCFMREDDKGNRIP